VISCLRIGAAAACLTFASLASVSSFAQPDETSVSSDRSQMLIGSWTQGAERIVGEGNEQVRISQGLEDIRGDGTSNSSLRMEIMSTEMPDDLRIYDVVMESQWRLAGDEYFTTPIKVDVTYAGDNPVGLNIAKAIEAEFMKPTDPMIIISLNKDNYVARGTDGTLISMQRKRLRP